MDLHSYIIEINFQHKYMAFDFEETQDKNLNGLLEDLKYKDYVTIGDTTINTSSIITFRAVQRDEV